MATTTNYGWTTPDDTALVKDGASAIRSLGTSVDTTTKNLNPSTTLGDIEYRSSTANTNTRLGIGSTGNVLTVAAGVPSWAAPAAGGGMTLISETIAASEASLSFTSLGSYKQLVLMWDGIRHSTTGTAFGIRFNNASGNVYYSAGITVNGSSADASTDSQDSLYRSGGGGYPYGESANGGAAFKDCYGQLIIDNYTSSTNWKHYSSSWGYLNNVSAGMRAANLVGVFASTTAITSIDIVRLSGTATFSNAGSSTIRLYGVN